MSQHIVSNVRSWTGTISAGVWISCRIICLTGTRFRALTVVDNFSRECVAIHAGKSL